MCELFDFIVEDECFEQHGEMINRPYMNVYMVKQAKSGEEERWMTLREFKERFSEVRDGSQRIELMRRIVEMIARF